MRPMTDLDTETLREYYRNFAGVEAAGTSPIYVDWASGVAEDEAILRLLLDLPRPKRQANLLFGAARHLGAGEGDYAQLRTWLLEHWDETRSLMLARSTQTNEAGRCAVLLPALAQINGPISLIEVGASAGLCLYPDRYSYTYRAVAVPGENVSIGDGESGAGGAGTGGSGAGESGAKESDSAEHGTGELGTVRLDPVDGPSTVDLECTLTGTAPPTRLPEVVWRAGIDLNPLDVTDPEDRAWLRSLIWPEHSVRRDRLDAAAAIAAAVPPRLVTGDLVAGVESLIAEAPADSQVVVFHSAVLAYVDPSDRAAFADLMRSRDDVVWVSNEGERVLPEIGDQLRDLGIERAGGRFVLAVDGIATALTGPHGQSYESLQSCEGLRTPLPQAP
ncbi:Uncharacterized protein conserved in bacteria (DUF2332) [Brevibacterium casei]|uniref:DUF2332 domain-containing protein n=2 Tax=Brevibacterium casei TaxID=33889 RepID=A0A449DBV8_9MICO|nr:DUF2332 domain-containing protein [Brevibacterium casei]VEW15052.1 Uncharacterized protein conserved in bacteria (DUF2332) [Brevibacterium casei]